MLVQQRKTRFISQIGYCAQMLSAFYLSISAIIVKGVEHSIQSTKIAWNILFILYIQNIWCNEPFDSSPGKQSTVVEYCYSQYERCKFIRRFCEINISIPNNNEQNSTFQCKLSRTLPQILCSLTIWPTELDALYVGKMSNRAGKVLQLIINFKNMPSPYACEMVFFW